MTKEEAISEELNGFYYGMEFDTYAAVPALNGSSLVHMRRSPMQYKYQKDNPSAPSAVMVLGTFTHRLILEPSRVGDVAVWGELEEQKVRRGKVWDQFQADNAGKTLLTVAESEASVGMAEAVRTSPLIRKYTDAEGPTEVSMFWRDAVTGRRMKCRVDKLIPKGHIIADLKTTRDCTRRKFGAQSYQLGYHIKMAIQSAGYFALTGHQPHMKLLAIESKAPHESAVYRLTSDVILQGLEEADELMRVLTNCERDNYWPPELETETDLTLPTWATTEQDADFEADEPEDEREAI